MESTQFNYALLRANFEPVADMENYIPAIRDSLQNLGYTSFEFSLDTESFINSESSFGSQNTGNVQNWINFSRERSPGFVLEPSSITFHTYWYGSHNSIASALIVGLEAVHQAISLDHITRLGFRNLKSLDSETEDMWKVYFDYFGKNISVAKAQYTLLKRVFATDMQMTKEKGRLTLNIHYTDSPDNRLADSKGEYSSLFDESITEFSDTEDQMDQPLSVIFDTEHFIDTSFTLENDQIRKACNLLILKSDSISKTLEEPNFRMNYQRFQPLIKSENLQPGIS